MTWKRRFRLMAGILVIALIVSVLLINLNYSMSHVRADSAKLLADTYTVGTDYSGTMTKQYVEVGDAVTAGEKLFVINSTVFKNDLATEHIDVNNLAFDIDEDNNIILTATSDGTMSDIAFLQGAFVPANKEVATIAKAHSLYVEASYSLTPPNYARIKNGNTVTVSLPNNQKVSARVFYIATRSGDETVETIVRARLVKIAVQPAFSVGTPVAADLQLSGKTLFTTVTETARNVFEPGS